MLINFIWVPFMTSKIHVSFLPTLLQVHHFALPCWWPFMCYLGGLRRHIHLTRCYGTITLSKCNKCCILLIELKFVFIDRVKKHVEGPQNIGEYWAKFFFQHLWGTLNLVSGLRAKSFFEGFSFRLSTLQMPNNAFFLWRSYFKSFNYWHKGMVWTNK